MGKQLELESRFEGPNLCSSKALIIGRLFQLQAVGIENGPVASSRSSVSIMCLFAKRQLNQTPSQVVGWQKIRIRVAAKFPTRFPEQR